MEAERDDTPCYVAIAPDCGCMLCVTVIDTSDAKWMVQVGKSVGDWIKRGMKVEQRTVSEAREQLSFCRGLENCTRPKKRRAVIDRTPTTAP